MAQVSNQAELYAALTAHDPLIQINDDFNLNIQMAITYSVTLESVSSANIHVLTKDATYYSYLFRISNNGAVTVRNLIIDGNKESHAINDQANRSVFIVAGGLLTLGEGCILRNNHAYREGGGVYMSGSVSYVNTFVMEANAMIVNCSSDSLGGGVIAALRNNEDSVTIRDNAVFANNSALNGGGLYYRSYIEGVGIPLTIENNVSFLNNSASANGGGIYVSGFSGGNSSATPFTLKGSVRIESNSANHGGGLYYYIVNPGDKLTISETVEISKNSATNNGGGINITSVAGNAAVSLSHAMITNNQGGLGGGIFLNSSGGCDLDFQFITVRDNIATSGSGGGIWFGTNANSIDPFIGTFDNTAISNNTAAIHGGGLYFQSPSSLLDLNIQNSKVDNNKAGQSGGGLLFNASGNLLISGGQISKNRSGQYGGGCYFNTNQGVDSAIVMSNVTVSGNTAAVSGGGLRLGAFTGTLATSLTDINIADNRSITDNGGGIWNSGANVRLTVNGNSLILRNATEAGNGGGIYFNSTQGGELLLDDKTKIQYNTANTTPSLSGNNGGGISINSGNLRIIGNTEISDNEALKSGGGINYSR